MNETGPEQVIHRVAVPGWTKQPMLRAKPKTAKPTKSWPPQLIGFEMDWIRQNLDLDLAK
jgi:hypothetical protein